MARRLGRTLGRVGSDRLTHWAQIAPVRTVLASGASVLTNFLTAADLAARPFTIIRVHLEISARSDQVAATENWMVGAGMCVISDQALAIGVTAIPTPITDLGSDLWFVHGILSGQFSFLSAVGAVSSEVSKDLDSKAMRKVNDDQDFALVVEAAAFNGLDVMTAGRMLIKDS